MTEITTTRALVEAELTAIYEDRSQLVPAEVVDVAKAEDHPLHPMFEWDDTVAGPAYRNIQATELIRSVTIRVSTETEDRVVDRKVRAWVPARYVGEAKPGYIPAKSVQSPEQREFLRRQVKRQITALYTRYGDTEVFWEALDELRRPAIPAPSEASRDA